MDATRQILKDNPTQRILILTDADSEKAVRDSLQAGVCGWILKSDGVDDLATAVKALQQDNCTSGVRTPAVLIRGRWRGSPGPTTAKAPRLSPREREVLQLLAEGRRSKEVAEILNISTKTAETHRNNLMSKLNLHSIAKLVVYAVRNEVIRVQFPAEAGLPEGENHSANVSVQSLN